MNRRNVKRGFTLMEVLLVIVILLMLGTVGVVSYSKIREDSQKKTTLILVNDLDGAVNRYALAVGTYPTDDEGLGALFTRPDEEARGKAWDSGGPFITGGKIPQDAWHHPLAYKRVDDATASRTALYFHIYSIGPNGTDDNGTGDDIPAWAEGT